MTASSRSRFHTSSPLNLVSRNSDSSHNSRAGHPGWLRCSSLTYSRYARSSRLAIRAPRSGTHATNHCYGTLVSLMLLPILLLRDELVLIGEPLPLARVARGRRGLLRGADREAGRQPIEVLAPARRARDRRVLGARQGLELVSAHAAMKVV